MGTGLMLHVYCTVSPECGGIVMVLVNPGVMWALRRSWDPSYSLQGGCVVLKFSKTDCCLPKSCKCLEGQCSSPSSGLFLAKAHVGSLSESPLSHASLSLSTDGLSLYLLLLLLPLLLLYTFYLFIYLFIYLFFFAF